MLLEQTSGFSSKAGNVSKCAPKAKNSCSKATKSGRRRSIPLGPSRGLLYTSRGGDRMPLVKSNVRLSLAISCVYFDPITQFLFPSATRFHKTQNASPPYPLHYLPTRSPLTTSLHKSPKNPTVSQIGKTTLIAVEQKTQQNVSTTHATKNP